MTDPLVGTEVGGHRLEGVAGRGGMGVVYIATDLRLRRQVALKVIAPDLAEDPEFRARFERESELAASLRHPHVVTVYGAGEQDGLLFVTMELIDGVDLGALIGERGALDAPLAIDLVGQVAGALDAAHARGLVHRDVKPGNVLIETTATGMYAYLTDFGLTKETTSDRSGLTNTGAVVGTVDYLAPEQFRGGLVDARTDVYSLGCVLYQALTRTVPFPRPVQLATMWAHANDPRPSVRDTVPALPDALDDVVRRAMAIDPDERFPSAGDFARAAHAALAGRTPTREERSVAVGRAAPSTVTAPAPPVTVARRRRRLGPRGSLAAAAIVAALAAAVLVVLLAGDDEPPKSPEGEVVGDPLAIGRNVQDMAFGAGSAWATHDAPHLTRVRMESRTTQKIAVGSLVAEPTFGGGRLWVRRGSSLRAIDPASHRVLEPPDGVPADWLAYGDAALWVASFRGYVQSVHPRTMRVGQRIGVRGTPGELLAGNGYVFAFDDDSVDIDVVTLEGGGFEIDQYKRDSSHLRKAELVEGTIYYASGEFPRGVNRIDGATGLAGRPYEHPPGARDFTVGAGSLWRSLPLDRTVERVDLKSGRRIGRPIDVPIRPDQLYYGLGRVWVVETGRGLAVTIEP